MRQWKGKELWSGDVPMATVAYNEGEWEALFAPHNANVGVYKTFDSEASARQYAERMLDMWLVRAELREV